MLEQFARPERTKTKVAMSHVFCLPNLSLTDEHSKKVPVLNVRSKSRWLLEQDGNGKTFLQHWVIRRKI